MSIYGKIKHWWAARREAKRAWWTSTIRAEQTKLFNDVINSVDQSKLTFLIEMEKLQDQTNALIQQAAQRTQNVVEFTTAATQSSFSKQLETLQSESEAIKSELNGIRSRYHWVEERYQEVTKTGIVPREFNFTNRQ